MYKYIKSNYAGSQPMKIYNVYFKDQFYGQVEAESEDDAWYQYEDVIPGDELASVDHDYLPDYIFVVPADEDDIEGCDKVSW